MNAYEESRQAMDACVLYVLKKLLLQKRKATNQSIYRIQAMQYIMQRLWNALTGFRSLPRSSFISACQQKSNEEM